VGAAAALKAWLAAALLATWMGGAAAQAAGGNVPYGSGVGFSLAPASGTGGDPLPSPSEPGG